MRKILLFVMALFCAQWAWSQHPTCDGNRYTNFVFPSLDTTTVKFGENTTWSGTNQELFMDVFEPSGDQATMRPAIVFAYGGAFIGGQREDVHGLCSYFASKGYVTVAIDYRLYDAGFFTDSTQAVDAVIKAVGDMKASIRYLREDAATTNQFRIDTNYIYAGGISAGAITAAHVAYLDPGDVVPPAIMNIITANGGMEGSSSTNTQYSSRVRGVINYSGALKDAEWMDAGEADVLYSAHDTGDNIVPFDSRSVFVGLGVTIYLEGSQSMNDRAMSLGLNQDLYTVNSSGHVSYLNNNFNVVLGETTDLLFSDLCAGVVAQEDPMETEISLFPNPVQGMLGVRLGQGDGFTVELYDLRGQRVWTGSSDLNEARFDVNQLTSGLYVARVMTLAGQVHQSKIMVGPGQ